MIPISRAAIERLAKEADTLAPDTLVLGLGFIKYADTCRVFCDTCGQALTTSNSVDAEQLLKHEKILQANKYGAMLVVPVADIQTFADAVPSQTKCLVCGTVGTLLYRYG
jgi:hypothetical protein